MTVQNQNASSLSATTRPDASDTVVVKSSPPSDPAKLQSQFTDGLISLLVASTNADQLSDCLYHLQHMDPPAIDGLRIGLAQPKTRATAASWISNMGHRALPLLPELPQYLNDDDPTIRRRILDAIGNIGAEAKHLAEVVRPHLKDSDARTTVSAAEVLMKIAGDDSGRSIVEAARESADAKVREDGERAWKLFAKKLSNEQYSGRVHVMPEAAPSPQEQETPSVMIDLLREMQAIRTVQDDLICKLSMLIEQTNARKAAQQKKRPRRHVPPTPEKIREIRESLNLTQSEAAAKVGVALSSWQNWEYGVRVPNARMTKEIEKLASAP